MEDLSIYKTVTDFEIYKNGSNENIISDFRGETANDGGYSIVRYEGFDEPYIRIPAEIDGKRITSIGAWLFMDNQYLKGVIIEDGIEYIDFQAFENCSNLSFVKLPNTLKGIGHNAFCGCHITSIALPDGIKTIGSSAFKDTWLEEVELPDSLDSVKGLEESSFASCMLKRVKLPKNLIGIPKRCFAHNGGLQEVIWPENLTVIANEAFYGCSIPLNSLPESLSIIKKRAFFGNANKDNPIIFKKNLTIIEDAAFAEYNIDKQDAWWYAEYGFSEDLTKEQGQMKGIFSIVFEQGCNTKLGKRLFWGIDVKDFYIPASITKIGDELCHLSTPIYCEKSSAAYEYARINDLERKSYGENLEKLLNARELARQEEERRKEDEKRRIAFAKELELIREQEKEARLKAEQERREREWKLQLEKEARTPRIILKLKRVFKSVCEHIKEYNAIYIGLTVILVPALLLANCSQIASCLFT